ncbi:restriction endonuclease subunit S [Uliginosibacterium sp. 31-16]|uniref:restriction endonuclease subunit S n=1 Tax=Uliginosibacterium sp. 31-16 TaxID=3068315 RepID=UPI00273EEB3B|nr:restriction endonuclease subunit S [Uliginosibacterium sp. 31-16]MDP5239120.1 restriction endonuclease subunit S [Uliginosibacterium sp. 31-16]
MISLPLKAVCQIRHGGTPSKENEAYWRGDIPWVSPKDMKASTLDDASDHISQEAVGRSATCVVPSDATLVVVRSGILAHSFPVARALRPLAFNQDIKALISTDERIDPVYLNWFVRSCASQVLERGVKKGATVHSVQSGFVESLEIPLFTAEKQQGIVDVLSRAEGIVRLQQQALDRAKALIPALFVEHFGDPATNPKGWPLRKVSDFVAAFQGGKNFQAAGEDEAASVLRILKVSAVTQGVYRSGESKPVPQGYIAPESHFVRKGDLLFSRANTEELVGATAYVFEESPGTLLPDKLWRFVWKDDVPMEPLFVLALFQNQSVRSKLSQIASGTSGSMKNISQGKLMELVLPIPPFSLQQEFASRLAEAQSIIAQQTAAFAKSRELFDALLAQTFAPTGAA